MKLASLTIGLLLFSLNTFAERPVRGSYVVPTNSNPNLEIYASYPLKYKSDNYDDPNTLQFELPAALTGEAKPITLTRVSAQSNEWIGEKAKGTCEIIIRDFQCKLHFNDLNINMDQVKATIDTTYPSQMEKTGRLEVATKFSGEPVGIVIYKLRGRDAKK